MVTDRQCNYYAAFYIVRSRVWCLISSSNSLCFDQPRNFPSSRTHQLRLVERRFFSPMRRSLPFSRELSRDYSTNFRRTTAVLRGRKEYSLVLFWLGVDASLFFLRRKRAHIGKENCADDDLELLLLGGRETTARNVETIYRRALELVIILLLRRFHSVIDVTATSQCDDNEKDKRAALFRRFISPRFLCLTTSCCYHLVTLSEIKNTGKRTSRI